MNDPPEGGGSEGLPVVRRARVGEPIDVGWPARPSTGFRWELDPLPEGIDLRADRYDPELPVRPGRGGTQRFRFEADRAGRFTIRFRYRRLWAPAEVDARELRLIVEPLPDPTGPDPG